VKRRRKAARRLQDHASGSRIAFVGTDGPESL
jgi:hypothetical protein